jgi:hypothetical protein
MALFEWYGDSGLDAVRTDRGRKNLRVRKFRERVEK